MALYFENKQEGPQTHILMIGVGAYPFLNGGDRFVAQRFDAAQSMGQLGSPSYSVKAFYEAALRLNQNNCWAKPLGSIDVLLSVMPDFPEAFPGNVVEPAIRNNISDAYWRWKDKCDTHEDNVALFFFCGHGLEKAGEQYLLAEDFGENPRSPWDGTFAFDMTRRAFSTCKAKTQIFMVDSCRQVTGDMLSTGIPMNPIEAPNLLARDCKYSLVQKAAATNEQAYGKVNEASFYTKAIIKALEGNAADNDSGNFWKVTTGTLAAKMNMFLQAECASEGYAQRCISTINDVTTLIHLNKPPEVPFSITCDPEQALKHAVLSYQELNTNEKDSRQPESGPWNVNVSAGLYMVEASFAQKNYKNSKKYKPVAPPWANEQLNCN
ncbi:caspase family protein [Flavobacterium sp.]|uniref:caspase family protein n=1 Tax=Flavobacterium sp. TaxID=239 RepID=UPI003D6B1A9B